jgi:hypothetical protein
MKTSKHGNSKKVFVKIMKTSRLRLVNFTLAFAFVGTILLLFAGAAPIPGFYGSVEYDQYTRINGARAAHGRYQLPHIECLNSVAEVWTERMVIAGQISHNPGLATSVNNYCGRSWDVLGENVGVGYSSETIFNAFMNSTGHKANILDSRFTRTGVGAYWSSDGRLFVTHVFARCTSGCSGTWGVNAAYPADPVAPVPKARRLYTDGNGKGYLLDSWGKLWPLGGAPLSGNTKWNNWDIARALSVKPDLSGAIIMEGWGGAHPVGNAPSISLPGYWRGWDIARDLIITDWATGSGLQLDGWGGVYKFGSNPGVNTTGSTYWHGWDIAKRIAVAPGGGYTLSGWGSAHPFGTPLKITKGPYWKGFDIARDIEISPDGSKGYVLDGWGGTHPLTMSGKPASPTPSGGPYWPGQDVAVDLVITDWNTPKGYVLDVRGGIHPFGGAPALTGGPYW